jgi:hypothetical protein
MVVTQKSSFRILADKDVTLKSSIRSSLYYPTFKILLLLRPVRTNRILCRAARMLSVSLHVRYAPRHRCAHPVHLPVVACQVLVAPAVCSPRQLSGHGAQSTRRADGVLAPLTVRLLWAIRSARHRSACPIATCHPLTTRAVCSPRYLSGRRVPSALHAGSVLVPATFRSPYTFGSRRR